MIILTDRQTDQIEWINVTKGVAMLMVIWGHVSLSDNIVLLWFTKFHVPTFLILTGLLFAKTSKKLSGCKKTIRKTVIPYLTFSLFAMITDGILNYRMGYAVRVIIVDLYKTITLYGIHALWYLGSYMIAVCVFLVVYSLLLDNGTEFSDPEAIEYHYVYDKHDNIIDKI